MTPAAILAKALSRANLVEIAERSGVKVENVRHAARGARRHPINADDYLRLCAVTGIDPAPALAWHGPLVPGQFDRKLFAMGARAMRKFRRYQNIQRAADEIGVSVTTLSRIENGQVRGAGSMLAVCKYIGVHPCHYVLADGFTGNTTGKPLKSKEKRKAA